MKTAHFLPSIQDEASGPSYSVPRLCSSLLASGVSTELFVTLCDSKNHSFPVSVHSALPVIPAMCISPSLKKELSARKAEFDVVHTHGLWNMASVYPHNLKKSGRRPMVVCAPRGQLSSWALGRSKWKKRLMWLAFQKNALAKVDCFHATGEKEVSEIRDMGYKCPVALVPNGIDIPEKYSDQELHETIAKMSVRVEKRLLLYFGRVHPVKGLDILLHSWSQLESKHTDWDLLICGPGELDHVAEIKNLAKKLKLENVQFIDGAYGEEKKALYQFAELYVLPSHTENYGMTVAESLANGTPVISTTGTPWVRLADYKAGWTIELSQSELTGRLDHTLKFDKQALKEMGEYGRSWMENEFSWLSVSSDMIEVYAWLLERAEKPSCVYEG